VRCRGPLSKKAKKTDVTATSILSIINIIFAILLSLLDAHVAKEATGSGEILSIFRIFTVGLMFFPLLSSAICFGVTRPKVKLLSVLKKRGFQLDFFQSVHLNLIGLIATFVIPFIVLLFS
jgi:hypothetical protein